MTEQKINTFDWGDGTRITVNKPDLSKLDAVICPTPCFPEGEERTGKVVKPKPKINRPKS